MTVIKKLSECASPAFKTPEWEDFIAGVSNVGVSLPLDYEVKGTLHYPITFGEPISMLRVERNGVEALGHFMSSVVREIEIIKKGRMVVITENSIYLVTEE